jgi:hypothetical protein
MYTGKLIVLRLFQQLVIAILHVFSRLRVCSFSDLTDDFQSAISILWLAALKSIPSSQSNFHALSTGPDRIFINWDLSR